MNGLAARVRGTSPHTIQSYRDSLVLLLRFVATQTQRSVHQLDLDLARRLGRAAVAVWLRSTAAIRKLLRRPPPDVDLEADRRRLDADRAAVRRRRTEQTRERLTKARRETERRPSAKPLVQPGASSFPGQPARAPVILKGMANTLLAHLIPRFPVQSEPIATQALAYVLNAAPDVAKAFMSVMHQTGFEPFERGRIAAEERHGDGIPDLTIRDTAGVVRVLVENKSPKRSPSFVL